MRACLWLPVDDVVADILQAGHRAEGADDDDEGRVTLGHRDAILRAPNSPHTPLNTPPGCSLIWFKTYKRTSLTKFLGEACGEEREGVLTVAHRRDGGRGVDVFVFARA